MYFMGGGLGGRGALPPDNTPPPFLNLALGGFKHDIQFPRNPPPLRRTMGRWTRR